MTSIYDLDNEYGGRIITDDSAVNGLSIVNSGTGPALLVESKTPGQPAIAVYSQASASPLDIREVTVGGSGALFKAGVTIATAVTIGKTVLGNQTNAALVFGNLSMASVPVIDFGNNFVSVASISNNTEGIGAMGSAQKVIIVRAGSINYAIPLFGLSSAVNGPGAFVNA